MLNFYNQYIANCNDIKYNYSHNYFKYNQIMDTIKYNDDLNPANISLLMSKVFCRDQLQEDTVVFYVSCSNVAHVNISVWQPVIVIISIIAIYNNMETI